MMSASATGRRVGFATLVAGLVACGSDAIPEDAALYDAGLTAVADREGLDPPIWLHPLPSRIDRDAETKELSTRDFITDDSLVVEEIVAFDSTVYRRCDITSTGLCDIQGGAPWVIVSELVPRGDRGRVMTVTVRRPARPGPSLSTYGVRLNIDARGGIGLRLEPLP